ncbi:alpha/beta fold hydrolase [Marinilactibacillus sp. GCM10026970]|uniref:alpha/beta fold hydrolase n=1 Tax=Marinilactibacillus sp. GCM10026970 TaxID=3252642 RepID=UPI003619724B
MELERFKPFPTSDGALLQYFDVGEGIPLILLAGGQTTVQTFKYVTKELKTRYRVIGLERRFEGETKAPFREMNLLRQGKDLNEFLEFIGVEKPILIGHSMGSSTIMSYLSQFKDQNITSAIFVDQTPKMLNDSTWDAGMPELTKDSIPAFFEKPASPLHKIPKPKILWLLFNTMIRNKKSVVSIQDKLPLFTDHAEADWRESLQSITKPVLFIGAEYSPYWPPKHAEICANLVENGTSRIMKAVGHGAHMEDHDQFVQIVKDWIEQFEKQKSPLLKKYKQWTFWYRDLTNQSCKFRK